ncbi:putative DnaJ domain, Chaperone J-domain superfamily [Helianthus annuus]|uniref:DnaJ domain, Chaperone J-domain superfamily n=1 Tax=Helianthus annuus TaxID=4232 RepID=A0A251TV04_HELAN|nr:putative DnaJ domain, Chaperone J-domain superfamily [Helianthus annuus]KAJ0532310.1 putative DnaJ domain, Chaperone J-domain superfamily [Helianthus annuus]KAJ0705954.1 putative DnaJ domain, Chaperone J-domain superfamily [Helianthus annuus]KAJ0710073.1 putative DnaJ domain, Chaperone J-domain superfamily [Helianthus annuus]KAJ0751933.1 putative DnaJ domain, Chaperone J-domain superfamily [Helianthus annuus]
MDGNKDEALKCLKIGKDALGLGDRVRALKFITKAQRLDPSLPVNDLLSSLEDVNSPESPAAAAAGAGNSDGVRRRGEPGGSGLGLGSGSGLGSVTQEQITIVREIRKKKDYYDVLGLEKSCSVEDIRKAYRKLSLKVHPDKNKAAGAEEAFKKVSKAFQCLSDEESRKQYDVSGTDEPVYERQNRRRANQGFGNGFYYEGDVDAEEIFRNFFFGGMNPRAATQFNGFNFGAGTRTRATHHESDGFNMRSLLQLLPVLVILLVSFLPSNEPVYSLSRTYTYEHRLVTQRGVSFFVKSRNFEQDYPVHSEERTQLEGRIEHEYLSILSHNCRLETQRLHWGYQRNTPNCDALKKFDADFLILISKSSRRPENMREGIFLSDFGSRKSGCILLSGLCSEVVKATSDRFSSLNLYDLKFEITCLQA